MLSRKLLFNITHNNHHSTYRYDDAGNRTVKLSGNGEAVFVCASDSSNGFTQTNRFTAYPNPYMVYNGSRYYKHIYVGSERIVSKVSVNNPDYDPRQVDCAGNEITGYNVKLQSQQQALSDSIASIYAKFEVPYYPNNNDDYGYNWNDGLRRSVATSDSYGELAYFYHSDHLGSTSFVTDANGEVSQHVEYVPFGEVFIEELSSSAKLNTPFLFNGKELDEETGLYYYGARYYDPRTSLWLSTDPFEIISPHTSTYTFCKNNPLNIIDPHGLTDFEVDGDIKNINDGHNNLKISVSNSQYIGLQKEFSVGAYGYERMLNDLSKKNGYMTSSIYFDTEYDCVGSCITQHLAGGLSYSEWSILEQTSPAWGVLNGTSAIAETTMSNLKDINIGDNGKLYFRKNSGQIFNGNQYVTTTSAAIKYSKLVKGVGVVGLGLNIAYYGNNIYLGYIQDGNRLGYNTSVQIASAAGGISGGILGAKVGASIGASVGSLFGGIGAVPGAFIGTLVGGVIGMFSGEYIGEGVSKKILK